MTIVLRPARLIDAPLLAEAERTLARIPGRLASQPHELRDDAFGDEIERLSSIDNGIYLVAEDAGAIVGHARLRPLDLAVTAHVVVLTIAVHEGQQGKGIGRQLMAALIAWARQNALVEKIELRVRSSNERAIALYRSCSFVEEGRMVKRLKIGAGEYLDDICMGLWVA